MGFDLTLAYWKGGKLGIWGGFVFFLPGIFLALPISKEELSLLFPAVRSVNSWFCLFGFFPYLAFSKWILGFFLITFIFKYIFLSCTTESPLI